VTLVLSYRRDGRTYSGRVIARDTGCEWEVSAFDGLPFARALDLFAHDLAHAPDGADAVFERTDRQGLTPYVLEAACRARLRAGDPALIRELSEPQELFR
jgi:hypothetical protein